MKFGTFIFLLLSLCFSSSPVHRLVVEQIWNWVQNNNTDSDNRCVNENVSLPQKTFFRLHQQKAGPPDIESISNFATPTDTEGYNNNNFCWITTKRRPVPIPSKDYVPLSLSLLRQSNMVAFDKKLWDKYDKQWERILYWISATTKKEYRGHVFRQKESEQERKIEKYLTQERMSWSRNGNCFCPGMWACVCVCNKHC